MANFCLPKELTRPFLTALKNGTLDPVKLSEMSSEARRAEFEKIVGKEYAKPTNALFESKLLLKNQQAGVIRWAKSVGGLNPSQIPDLVSKINKMTKLLTPEEENNFLADLAEKKLGAQVTVEEAKSISDLAQKANASKEALEKSPTDPKAQMQYGRDYLNLQDHIELLKPKPSIWTATNIINLPKSALTSVLHFSAPFVQGRGLLATKPWWEAFGNQFKNYASSDAYRNSEAAIVGHPNYRLAVSGKLGLTKLGDRLSMREEALQSSLLEHVPILKSAVKASSRAFTGFLNEVRFKNFNNLIEAARLRGEDVSIGSQNVKDIAQTVNNFSGRGNLGENDRFTALGPRLNNIFFSPRKIIATVQMFNPMRYLDPRISTTAKIGALKYMAGTLVTQAAILELAHLAGAQINLDPTSTDFLKIRIGKTTIDTTGGAAIYTRLLAREIENKSTSSKGQVSVLGAKYGSTTRLDLAGNFLRDKLAPAVAGLVDFLQGKDVLGRPFNLYGEAKGSNFFTSEIYNKFGPIVTQQFIDMIRSNPQNALMVVPVLSALASFGVDVQTPEKL